MLRADFPPDESYRYRISHSTTWIIFHVVSIIICHHNARGFRIRRSVVSNDRRRIIITERKNFCQWYDDICTLYTCVCKFLSYKTVSFDHIGDFIRSNNS